MAFSTFDLVLILCGVTGLIMVVGSIVLLYQGVIKLGERSSGTALEAEFKNQLKVNVRNPALGLFAIGFSFFLLALYFAKPKEWEPIVIRGHIRIPDAGSILVKLKTEEWPMQISSEGGIYATIQPLEKLVILIDAPGYRPSKWYHQLMPKEAINGRIEIKDIPEFMPTSGAVLGSPKLDKVPPPTLDAR
jgi:hypothetical protein